jgi:hypothetical protein
MVMLIEYATIHLSLEEAAMHAGQSVNGSWLVFHCLLVIFDQQLRPHPIHLLNSIILISDIFYLIKTWVPSWLKMEMELLN